jgi:magnesium-protoporphyrin O-methyltransferase
MRSLSPSTSYEIRRGEIETYFDRTAAATWQRLTSDAPVSGIRATVRAGRDRMRATLLSWLPADLSGRRILDAGCGTGALSIAAAERGARVTAIDLSPTLVAIARERAAAAGVLDRIAFRSGDMLSSPAERFDHVVAMDALIHYRAADMVDMVARLASRTEGSLLFTYAPRTPALTAMHAVGRLFPRSDRAPAIEPVAGRRLSSLIERHPALGRWSAGREARITSGFYLSSAKELVPQ